MNVWTAFFLVVSIVILATPLFLSRDAANRNGSGRVDTGVCRSSLADDELELDYVSGRLTREDYEVMSGQNSNSTRYDDDD